MKRKLHLFGYMFIVAMFFTGCNRNENIALKDTEQGTPSTEVIATTAPSPGETTSDLPVEGLPSKSTPGADAIPTLPLKDVVSITPTLIPTDNGEQEVIPTPTGLVSQTSPTDSGTLDSIRLFDDKTKAQIDQAGSIVGVRINDNKIVITSVIKAPMESIVIPAQIEDYEVTSIASMAFSDSRVKNVELEQGISKIESKAFYGHFDLIKIKLPSSITTIGQNAFGNCMHLTTIEVADENESYTVKDGILYNKTVTSLLKYPSGRSDETLLLPDTVVKIEDGAFSMSKYLCYIVFPTSLRSIGYEAFAGCPLLNINVPQTIIELEAYAFADCYQIHEITIPKKIRVIPEGAFSGCENAFRLTFLGQVDQISYSAFANCSSLNKVTFSDSVDVIGELAFAFCTSLIKLEIPGGSVELADMAFYSCKNLKEIKIPSSVSYYGAMVFDQAKQVKIIAPKSSMAISYAITNDLEYEIIME